MLKTFMYFTMLTFAVVVVWIGLTIYWNFKPQTLPADEIKVVPIVGSFDFETINRLKSRRPITADFNATFVSSASASNTIDSTPEEASTSAQIESTVPTLEPLETFSSGSAQQL